MFSIVVLPLPDGPTIATNSPNADLQVDAAQSGVVEAHHPIRLLDALELD